MMMNVVSVYALQVGCELEEKEKFWSEFDEVVESIPREDRVVIGTTSMAMLMKGTELIRR